MPRLTRVHSFLDRFEQRLQVDCEQLKRQLLAQVDERFGFIREKVAELRRRFGSGGQSRSARSVEMELPDDPPVETVQLEEWKQEQTALLESSRDIPSTSTGRKRKSSSSSGTAINKRHKTVTTAGSNKHLCKSPGCGISFRTDFLLAMHERIHLNIKPFSCAWPDCRYFSERKANVVRHINKAHVRTQHFKLPKRQKDQARLNIVDNRNPEDYVQVDHELLERRLE